MQNRKILLRIVALALLIYALLSLLGVQRQLRSAEARREALLAELARLRQEQAELDARLAAYGSEEELRRLAWERLGMVAPGEVVYYFTDAAAQRER